MANPTPRTYTSSPSKNFIREQVDRPLLERLHKLRGEPLSYFGLPGADLLDIRSWEPLLGKVAAVERDLHNLNEMNDAVRRDMPGLRFVPHYGEVDQVILRNRGMEWKRGGAEYQPWAAIEHPAHRPAGWYFDVVNLDYFGPFLPEAGRQAQRRANAIRKLCDDERVDGWSRWVLLITVEANLITPEITHQMRQYLRVIQDDASAQVASTLGFLTQLVIGDEELVSTRLIHAVATSLIARSASRAQAYPRGTIFYEGSGGQPMVHLAYEFFPVEGVHLSSTSLDRLLRSPLLRVTPGTTPHLKFFGVQAPNLTDTDVRDSLAHLHTMPI